MPVAHTNGQIVINEVQSSQNFTIADEDGDYEDWIELYNTGSETVSLGHYAISDDYGDPYKWLFPADTSIAPDEFLLVWASGKDRATPGEPLHTNFRISSSGEEVLLTDVTDGSTIDDLPPTPIPSDYSYGRYPDGTDNWYLFSDPTPGTPNQKSPYEGITREPEFSKEPGFYSESFYLQIVTGHPGDVIHYTLDGSEPTTDSPVYSNSNPLYIHSRDGEENVLAAIRTAPDFWHPPDGSVFKGQIVRAIAVREGQRKSEIASGSWFIHPKGPERYTFPVVSIITDPEGLISDETGIMVIGEEEEESRGWRNSPHNYYQRGIEWERPSHITFFDKEGVVSPEFQDESGGVSTGPLKKGFEQNVGLRIHGGHTRRFPQKSLRIYARSNYDWQSDFTYPLFPGNKKQGTNEPLNTYKRLILRSSGDDWFHTMFKDAMVQSLYSDRLPDQQAYRPMVVFINGEYWGIHNLRERYDGWYIETNYGIHRDDVAILSQFFTQIEISQGTVADRSHYTGMRNYARDNDLSDPEHFDYIGSKMDIENYLQYKTFKVYTANADWPHNNVRFWRKRTDNYQPDAPYGADGRWRWMIFDLDASFSFRYRSDEHEERATWAQYNMDMMEWITTGGRLQQAWINDLFNGLIENESFRNRFIAKLAGDLNTRYRPDFVATRVNQFRELYQPEIAEHIARYPRSAGTSLSSWNGHVDRMVEFAQKRPEHLRKNIKEYFDLSGTSWLDLMVLGSESGHVRVDDVDIHPDTPGVPADFTRWNGIYFNGIPVTLTAVPKDGHQFIGWRDGRGNPIDFENSLILRQVDDEGRVIQWKPDDWGQNIVALFEGGENRIGDDLSANTLGQNYPNPFNDQTNIPYRLDERATVTIELYSVDGRKIRSYPQGSRDYGENVFRLQISGLASGFYLYRMRIVTESGLTMTSPAQKMMLIR